MLTRPSLREKNLFSGSVPISLRRDACRRYPPSQAVVLSQEGRGVKLAQYLQGKSDLLCLIGGFSKGEYRSDIRRAGEVISIFDQPPTEWTVASEIIVSYENALDL